jgi:hypothetical protein
MNAEEFVANWKREKETLLQTFLDEKGESLVASKIDAMRLTDIQKIELKAVLESVLTDTMYTLLLGLDGSASIGAKQHSYKILDEDGNLISGCEDIESEAWKQFHGNT